MCSALHKGLLSELAKFASVGVLNTILGLIIIYALKWMLNWGDVSANMAGYSTCIFLGFMLNGRWTFGLSTLRGRHLLGYLLMAGIAYLMNLLAVLVSIRLLGLPGDFAQLVGVPAFTLTSFVLNKKFVFSGKR